MVLTAFQNVANALVALEHDGQALRASREAATDKLQRLTRQQLDQGYVVQLQWLSTRQTWLRARLATLAAQAVYLGTPWPCTRPWGGG